MDNLNFKNALSKVWEEDALIFIGHKVVGLICIGKSRDYDKDNLVDEI